MKSNPPTSATSSCLCDYCGLPIDRQKADNEPSYCCYGCRFAASLSAPVDSESTGLGPASALGLSVFFTVNVVMMTMALWSYAGQSPFEIALANFLRYGAMLFSAPVLLLLGRPLISHAVFGLKHRSLNTDLLLASGVLASYALSVFNTWRGEGHVYFEVGCVILVLVTLGRWMEAGGKSQASQTLDQLERLVPANVRRILDGSEEHVSRDRIRIGDLVHIVAGERVPLDGQVRRGRGVVDEQFFTGESAPVEKQYGDPLFGGSLNLDGDLVIEVTSPPEGGALGRLVEAVRVARLSKGRYQLLSDTWSRVFFPVIAVVAMGAFVVHGLASGWEAGLLTAMSVVVIACPCALALATPLAVWTAMGTAAQKGVLCRSGAALETLAQVRAIRWDKTGTLTTGSPCVLQMISEQPEQRSEFVRFARCLTAVSNHLFSKAIREFLGEIGPEQGPWCDIVVETISGRGLRGEYRGDQILLGSMSWMESSGFAVGPIVRQALRTLAFDRPVVALGYRNTVQVLFILNESVRPEAAIALEQCQSLGMNQAVLTGDRATRAAKLPLLAGLSVEAELLPEQKLAAIHRAHSEFGCVAMVGDGLNDAPALAAADIGIAMGCGADVSRDSADICLLSADLRLVPWACSLARRTVSTIRTNLAWSFGYNSLGIVFAASGQLHPALAAGLMVASSIMVLANSLRLSESPSRLAGLDDPTSDFHGGADQVVTPQGTAS